MDMIRETMQRLRVGEEAIALRRHLHAHPDLSEQETPTMELICEKLDALGLSGFIATRKGQGYIIE